MARSLLSKLIQDRVDSTFEFGGYEISRATSESERREAYRLRFDVFAEEGLVDPSFFPDQELRDEFDATSTQILVRTQSGELVATTRFVHPSQIGFPTERLFDFDPPRLPRNRLGEYGRLAIKEGHRGGARAPMLGMLKAVFECMLQCGVTHVYAFLSPELARSYARLGCVSHPLVERSPSAATRAARAPMRGYFDRQHAYPVLFDLHEMMVEVGVPIARAGNVFDRGSTESPVSVRDRETAKSRGAHLSAASTSAARE